ncbi:elav-like protein 2 [Nannochloropsis gaditana]|uniref:Elav-like protein 2 n=1 Tax=Nannochloropsis gaditana TaxID=72520 RepID=W7TZD3_9STRA|nr:elav-like protein 2 [Nannochloropsis gaditana]
MSEPPSADTSAASQEAGAATATSNGTPAPNPAPASAPAPPGHYQSVGPGWGFIVPEGGGGEANASSATPGNDTDASKGWGEHGPSQAPQQATVSAAGAGGKAGGSTYSGEGTTDRTNLIVNYLPNEIDDMGLRELFQDFGQVESARVIREKGSGRSLGYGFVKYKDPQSADSAILTRNGHQVYGKRIKVSVARPASEEHKHTKLYVANLPHVRPSLPPSLPTSLPASP